MSDWLRMLGAQLFGWRWVVLVDFDSERNIRRVKFRGGKAYAARWAYIDHDVFLQDNGKVPADDCVVRWEPYVLGAPNVHPKWSGTP